jgi:uncharacterized membrane protein YfcA
VLPLELLVGLLGLFGAFTSALLGIGGAIIMLPLLLYTPPLFGLPPLDLKTATGLAVAQVFFATAFGTLAHRRHGTVDHQLILWVAPAMTVGSMFAALFSGLLPNRLLLGVFAVVATAAGGVMFLPLPHGEDHDWSGAFSRPRACVVGLGAGTLVGLIGSGTYVLAPSFLYLLKVPTRVTIGSTLGVALFAALAATLGKAATGLVPLGPAVAILVATVPGVRLGAHVSSRLPPRLLRLLLTLVILLIALRAWVDLLR